jgi:hypothetical protein
LKKTRSCSRRDMRIRRLAIWSVILVPGMVANNRVGYLTSGREPA